jgi:hypothetical protein
MSQITTLSLTHALCFLTLNSLLLAARDEFNHLLSLAKTGAPASPIADHLGPPGKNEKGTLFRFCEIASGMGRHFLYMPSEVALGLRLTIP